jgi:hypothetical protein
MQAKLNQRLKSAAINKPNKMVYVPIEQATEYLEVMEYQNGHRH